MLVSFGMNVAPLYSMDVISCVLAVQRGQQQGQYSSMASLQTEANAALIAWRNAPEQDKLQKLTEFDKANKALWQVQQQEILRIYGNGIEQMKTNSEVKK